MGRLQARDCSQGHHGLGCSHWYAWKYVPVFQRGKDRPFNCFASVWSTFGHYRSVWRLYRNPCFTKSCSWTSGWWLSTGQLFYTQGKSGWSHKNDLSGYSIQSYPRMDTPGKKQGTQNRKIMGRMAGTRCSSCRWKLDPAHRLSSLHRFRNLCANLFREDLGRWKQWYPSFYCWWICCLGWSNTGSKPLLYSWYWCLSCSIVIKIYLKIW